jgi:hypothetical protein
MKSMREDLPNRRYATAGPSPIRPRIPRRRRRGDGTPEILLDSPDCVEIQLQDVSYCGGRGPLGNMCG